MKKSITLLFLFFTLVFVNAQGVKTSVKKAQKPTAAELRDSVLRKHPSVVEKKGVVKDTFFNEIPVTKLRLYKKSVHASYYADKFNGRRTTSGVRFSNNEYTAAHKKFPFGTKLKITNEANGKSVIVEVIDRGPFVRSREIDLTKRAYMEIAKNKGSGSMIVTIEEVVK
ncbi:septal ring lytic transglycosylase RlpA family protein [Flavobacterium flavipallidum]|uniref:Septal ring lytic transglycosylase RlpA family protein n=1 Tax=Flavobacterium flavipallidum TaxID=3139140 RepID=A0ABU9HM89_9FLAO